MPPTKEPASPGAEPATKANAVSETKASTSSPPGPATIVATMDARSGRLLSIEQVDSTGERHELSEDERAELSDGGSAATLETLVEQAFEAGINCVLGDDADETERPETKEDAELSRMLLRSLIEGAAAKRLLQRDVMSRAIVGTLIEQAAADRKSAAERAAAH